MDAKGKSIHFATEGTEKRSLHHQGAKDAKRYFLTQRKDECTESAEGMAKMRGSFEGERRERISSKDANGRRHKMDAKGQTIHFATEGTETDNWILRYALWADA